MVLLNGARNLWSRAFLGRGNTLELDNRITCWPSPSSQKPYQFDFWKFLQPELGWRGACPTVCRIWLLVMTSTRVWNAWTLPTSLQNLTVGYDFNQSLERVTLPSSLQNLTFGTQFNQSLEQVILPSSLQNLIFGSQFNQSLGTRDIAWQPAEFDFWISLQPEFGTSDLA